MESIITNEQLSHLPLRSYQGPIHLITSQAELERAYQEITQESVVGFDTETRPSFRSGESHPPALVQIATYKSVFLFRLNDSLTHFTFRILTGILENPSIIKVGIALAHDLKELKKTFRFFDKNVVDLAGLSKKEGFGQTGVRNLAGLLLGIRISKAQKITNWARQQLTPDQILYAATDAWVCLELYHALIKIEQDSQPRRLLAPLLVQRILLINSSYEKFLGKPLIESDDISPLNFTLKIDNASWAVLAHGRENDPIINYGNKTTLKLWDISFESLIQMPSRQTAEVDEQSRREDFLKNVAQNGFVKNYSGIRISSKGKRFRIKNATVWNVIDASGKYHGQAARFDEWEYL